MAVNSNALCSLSDVVEFANIRDDDPVNNTTIENLINEFTSFVHVRCRREQIKSKQYTEYYDGEYPQRLYVNIHPIISISSIYSDADWVWGSDTLIDPAYYRIHNSRSYIIFKDVYLLPYTQNIKITYTAGYSTIPLLLKNVAKEEVTRVFKGRSHLGSQTETTEGTTITYRDWDILPKNNKILDMFTLRNIYY